MLKNIKQYRTTVVNNKISTTCFNLFVVRRWLNLIKRKQQWIPSHQWNYLADLVIWYECLVNTWNIGRKIVLFLPFCSIKNCNFSWNQNHCQIRCRTVTSQDDNTKWTTCRTHQSTNNLLPLPRQRAIWAIVSISFTAKAKESVRIASSQPSSVFRSLCVRVLCDARKQVSFIRQLCVWF